MDTLNVHEARVFGALIEKSMTTPDQYPLSLNAATSGSNQKSNRNPVVDYIEAEVDVALQGLVIKGFAGRVQTAGSRVEKFRHNAHQKLDLGDAELAILAELLMRGPQTPGELLRRAARMSPIPTPDELSAHLESLTSSGFVAALGPAPGSRAGRTVQTLVPGLHPEDASPASGDHGCGARVEARLGLVELGRRVRGRVVLKPHRLRRPGELDRSRRAAALLAEDQLRKAALLGVLLRPLRIGLAVVLLAVQHRHDVGILLDGARFPEIAEPGPVPLPLLRRPVELAQADHRQVQLTGHRLDATADLADLYLA